MNAPNTTPILDLETAVAQIGSLSVAIAEYVSYALRADPGSQLRDDRANDALADLEELESVIRDGRAGIEALP